MSIKTKEAPMTPWDEEQKAKKEREAEQVRKLLRRDWAIEGDEMVHPVTSAKYTLESACIAEGIE